MSTSSNPPPNDSEIVGEAVGPEIRTDVYVGDGDPMDTSTGSAPPSTRATPIPMDTGPILPLGVQGIIQRPFPFPRSQSPAKRPASEMDGGDDTADYPQSPMSVNNEAGGVMLMEPEYQSSGSVPPPSQTFLSLPPSSSTASIMDSATGTDASTAPTSIGDGSSSVTSLDSSKVASTPEVLLATAEIPPESPKPTMDDQLQTVFLGIYRPIQEGDEYYIISGKWMAMHIRC